MPIDDAFLRSTAVIDWKHAAVSTQAHRLSAADAHTTARRCFEWVRDTIRHSRDYRLDVVTCTASEVIAHGSGYCYAKSHLLAALLRANGIPAGFCYQRLRMDTGARCSLHGLNAVWLEGVGWYRVDARGNRRDVDAQFTPPIERLAFHPINADETDLPEIWPDPLPVVVETLQTYASAEDVHEHLPDVCIVRAAQTAQEGTPR